MSSLPATQNLSGLPGSTATAGSIEATEKALENSPAGRKLLKATREFEADLITSWWQEAEKGIKDLGSGDLGSGLDGLKNVAMNSLAENMVKAGGLGIARMIFRNLEPALRRKMQAEGEAGPGSAT
jgi:Rod binding domain-containing protein